MLHQLTILAAEAGSGEPDKTLFYVAGGALAVWAVALGALGMSREDWPTKAGERTIIAISSVLVALTMTAAALTG